MLSSFELLKVGHGVCNPTSAGSAINQAPCIGNCTILHCRITGALLSHFKTFSNCQVYRNLKPQCTTHNVMEWWRYLIRHLSQLEICCYMCEINGTPTWVEYCGGTDTQPMLQWERNFCLFCLDLAVASLVKQHYSQPPQYSLQMPQTASNNQCSGSPKLNKRPLRQLLELNSLVF